jgi:tetratricopeptide (TPR) repeat protein
MKLNKKFQILILIIIIAIAGYFAYSEFYLNRKPSEEIQQNELDKLLILENKNPNVSEAEFNSYLDNFNKAKEVIEATPYALNPTHWTTIARMKKYVNDFEGAEQIYLFLLQRSPENYLVYGNLADLYINYLYDYELAVAAYWKAVNYTQHNAQINLLYYKNLADIYSDKLISKKKEFEEKAEQELSGKLFKDSIDFRTMLANYYNRIGDTENAIKYLEQALYLDPNNEAIKSELEFLK